MKIRNFSIISHIDHGKSTLADRFLESTETVSGREMEDRFLDNMELEKERGITIKLQPARMKYKDFILNMIDTPGHIDFSYEVSRSLKAVEGVILLIDATKGVQAQTIANLNLAKEQNLVIIPVINKIDLENARIEEVEKEIEDITGKNRDEIIKISAKEGKNIEALLNEVVSRIPPPEEKQKPSKALIFDYERDPYKGVIAFVRIFGGSFKKGDKIELIASGEEGEIKEIGFFNPALQPKEKLSYGEIGYIATGIKETDKVRVGDTVRLSGSKVEPLPGYKEPKAVVFTSFYPKESRDFLDFKRALEELRLSDPAFTFEPEFKEVFGRGFRCGFLGSLHVEIISERIKKDYGLDIIISTPSVSFKVITSSNEEIEIKTPTDFPDRGIIKEVLEPWAKLEIVVPEEYLGNITKVLDNLKGVYEDTKYISGRIFITYKAPFRKVVSSFYDNLKSASRGYASFSYDIDDFKPGDLTKMEVIIADEIKESFSKIISRDEIMNEGKKITQSLKELIPPEQFPVPIQAKVDGRIVSRETIKARRKDVTGDLYGGDRTRKRKLLEQQKEGKKKLIGKGKVDIPQDVFFKIFKGESS